MPMFEYICNECGNEFEDLSLSAKEDNPKCPSCTSVDTTRKISVFASSQSSGGSSCGGSSGFSWAS